jgi:hypothetical protein
MSKVYDVMEYHNIERVKRADGRSK